MVFENTRKLNNIQLMEIQVGETAWEITETFKYVRIVLIENFTLHDWKLTKGLE